MHAILMVFQSYTSHRIPAPPRYAVPAVLSPTAPRRSVSHAVPDGVA